MQWLLDRLPAARAPCAALLTLQLGEDRADPVKEVKPAPAVAHDVA